jgi:uncharacterized protein (UPF0332 family)
MTDEQRELLLKAQQSLEAAKLLLTNNYPDYATSRAYYSMFYIAEALPPPAPTTACSTSQKPF